MSRGVVLSLALIACSSSSPSDRPRATASVVFEAPPVDCTQALPDCWRSPISITDVRRDGDRVGVLLLREGIRTIYLYLSDDLGKTWRQAGLGGDLIANYGYHGGKIQLALHGGQAYLFLETQLDTSSIIRIARWNLDTQLLEPFETNVFFNPGTIEVNDTGRVTLPVDAGDARSPLIDKAMQAFELSTFEYDTLHPLCTDSTSPCYDTRWVTPDRGFEWQAFGVRPTSAGQGKACRYLYRYRTTSGASPYGELHCVPFAEWPAGARSGFDRSQWETFAVEGGPLYSTYEQGGESFAHTIIGDALSEPIPLGPGKPTSTLGFSSRSRTAGLLWLLRPARNGAERTFVRLNNGAGEEVDLPAYPCDGPCGDDETRSSYGTLQWIEPLEDGDYLAFWLIDEDLTVSRKDVMYAERVTPSFGPIRFDAIPVDPGPPASPLPAYPNAHAATDLIGACARYELCGFGAFNFCISNYGTNERYAPYSRETARQRIIEAAPNGCAAIAAVLPPPGCSEDCLARGGTCQPQGGCGLAPEDPTFCDARAVGMYCHDGRLIACDSIGGETVHADCEAAGTVCTPLPPIVGNEPRAACQGAPPCSETTPVCEGSVSRTCSVYWHCEDRAQVCGASGSCEYTPVEADATCHWGTSPPICAGDYVLHCIGNRYHYTKCSDVGFTGGCAADGGGARCLP